MISQEKSDAIWCLQKIYIIYIYILLGHLHYKKSYIRPFYELRECSWNARAQRQCCSQEAGLPIVVRKRLLLRAMEHFPLSVYLTFYYLHHNTLLPLKNILVHILLNKNN